jgi:hypothetical protein
MKTMLGGRFPSSARTIAAPARNTAAKPARHRVGKFVVTTKRDTITPRTQSADDPAKISHVPANTVVTSAENSALCES